MMRKIKNISFMFIAIFTIFMLGKNVNAAGITKYNTEADIEKAIINVSESKALKDSEKKSKVEEIVKLSSKDELSNLIEKKMNKVQQALKNDNMDVGTNQKITKKIDDLVSITVEGKDEAEDENGNPIPETQAQLWKAYGNRMYTYTFSGTLVPYIFTFKMKIISHYTVGAKGLTVRYVDDSHTGGIGIKITNKYTKWMSKSATKVGKDISAQAKWEIEVLPGIPIIGHLTEFTKFQKAYIKIVKWDKAKKRMYLNQHGRNWNG